MSLGRGLEGSRTTPLQLYSIAVMKTSIFRYGTFLLCLLGMLSAFGPFVTDMYLPALPQLQACFSTNASMVQLSLSTSMLGLAVGQIFFGPLSDKYGRKPVIIASLLLFILSTFACLYAPTIETFVALRLLQGVGGSGGIVSPLVGMGNIMVSTAVIFLVCAVCSLWFDIRSLRLASFSSSAAKQEKSKKGRE